MNLGSARAQVRYVIDEPAAAYWSDAELNTYLNEANRHVWSLLADDAQNLLSSLQVSLSYSAVASGAVDTGLALTASNLPPGALKLVAVDLTDSQYGTTALANIPYEDRYRYPDYSTSPEFWYTRGAKLFLLPMPSAAQTLYITYIPTATTLSADSDPLLNGVMPLAAADDCVVYYAAKLAAMKDEAIKLKGQIDAHYEMLKAKLINLAESWNAQSPRAVHYLDY